ncbi:hypothetical protein ACJJIC_19000 [Microbulbifer sp. ANSA002]|uniref:hypothetical protein n=1 Tax=unclassified Microbulbifer TaxID=2619833 RepID=UPI00404362D3
MGVEIEIDERMKNRRINYELINSIFTAVIVFSACISSYYSYQTVKIASANTELLEAQDARESRKEMKEMAELILKVYALTNEKESTSDNAQQ